MLTAALIVLVITCFASYLGINGIPAALHKGKAPVKAVEPSKKEIKSDKERAEQYSFIGWQVIKGFESLPDTHRPTADIEATVTALDFKHNSDYVNSHFPYEMVRYGRVPQCECITGRSPYYRSNGYGRGYFQDHEEEGKKTYKKCQRYAEYTDILEVVDGITNDIRYQAQALAEQERAVLLAGMQNDLDSAKSIAEALRNERTLISDTTNEINRQTRSIS